MRVVAVTADDVTARWFVHDMRRAAETPGTIIDGSRMNGAGDFSLHFEAVADGRLEYVDEVIDGIRQVPFFRITDKGRAWIAQVAS